MDNEFRTHVQRFDRVSMLEPQLRDTLSAVRESAQQAVHDCFMNYGWKSGAIFTDDADYRLWDTARRTHRDYNQRLTGLVAKLTQMAERLRSIHQGLRQNEAAAHEANVDFFLSLNLSEARRNTVSVYTYYMGRLLQYREKQAADDYGATSPEPPAQEVWDVVDSLLALNKSQKSAVCTRRRQEIQQSLQDWQVTNAQLTDELRSLVSEIDVQGNALDQANFAAAKAVRTKLAAYEKQDPRMAVIGQSAVDTCHGVILLAKRVAVVLGHPPTMGDTRLDWPPDFA